MTVIALSGSIGSGKSTLADALIERLPQADLRAFGDVVRAEAATRGYGSERAALQRTGVELIDEGWEPFVRKLLTPTPTADVVVVDGIRHVEAIEELRRQLPSARVYVVFVQASTDAVSSRFAVRGENPRSLEHEVESQLPEVAKQADLLLSGEDAKAGAANIITRLAF